MSNDSRFVLAQLARTAIWSKWCDLLKYERLVIEADSVVTHLYRYCVNQHIQRQKSRLNRSGSAPSSLDYNSATLINYQELALRIEQLLDYFARLGIGLIIVYRGKHMEAPLYGLCPAQFKKNTQRASECLLAMIQYESSLAAAAETNPSRVMREHKATLDRMRPTRPNLALTLFKMIVNSRVAASSKPSVETHQAFYCPYPTCARLARDFKCPVLTNDGDFIVMDVRAGFIMFEEFFLDQLMPSDTASRHSSASSWSAGGGLSRSAGSAGSSSSMARNQLAAEPAGRNSGPPRSQSMANLSSSESSFQRGRSQQSLSTTSGQNKSPPERVPKQVMVRFHYHRLFLQQHPGLNPALALQLFPLTSGEFLTRYAKSLVRLRIYEREYHEKDLIVATSDQRSFKKYHMAASRLELVMRFLCAKDSNVVPHLVRGEASRLNSAIERDYQGLYDYYAASYHFKGRLRLIMRQKTELDLDQANHIEFCLLRRECTADFWLSLMCCSLGQMSAVDFNKTMQFEDLQTKHSARSMLDLPKWLMMCLLAGDNKLHKRTRPPAMTSEQLKQLESRFPTASLTVIDRQGHQLVERTITGQLGSSGIRKLSHQQQRVFEQIQSHLTLSQLAKQNRDIMGDRAVPSGATEQGAIALMHLAFNASDMTKLSSLNRPKGLSPWPPEQLKQQSNHSAATRLATMLSLHRYSLMHAMRDDQYFKHHYLSFGQHFEVGLVNLHLYQVHSGKQHGGTSSKTSQTSLSSITSASIERRQLFDLVQRLNLENETNYRGLVAAEMAAREMNTKSSKTIKSSTSFSSEKPTEKRKPISKGPTEVWDDARMNSVTKLIRHLIELLEGSMEAYCELNAFLNYPLPQLQLRCYNPILLFNLTLASYIMTSETSLCGEARHAQSKLSSAAKKAKK